MIPTVFTALEICAGAGGQALGLDRAGFSHLRLVENDTHCCATLRARSRWRRAVRETDVREFRATPLHGQVDLLAGGVPCPPFSRAGKQLGGLDDRDLFPEALRLVEECDPRVVMLENVRGFLSDKFDGYREELRAELLRLGYDLSWRLFNAKDFGVPQLRPRAILVATKHELTEHFAWPGQEDRREPPTVGQALAREMRRGGWPGARAWAAGADGIAPTLVGGSKKHGGPDLGPSQARKQWEKLGVDGRVVAGSEPGPDWGEAPPRLTVRMAAILQGFPADWPFAGSKTAQYRQVGNAFPPPVAEAVGRSIRTALEAGATGAALVHLRTGSSADAGERSAA
jgi:DNA (cytosine-5)-methyltransferase 1